MKLTLSEAMVDASLNFAGN